MNPEDKRTVRARVEACIDEIPALSPTATKVLTLVDDIDAPARDLLKVIQLDPILSARVLKLVNSPHFGLEQPIASINRAVVILGINTVKNLALASVAMGAVTSAPVEAKHSAHLWRHCLWVGVAARAIARTRQVPRDDQELAFISGLLHDLGEVCIFRAFPGDFSDAAARVGAGEDQLDVERELFGGTHEEFGAMLARKWGFPEAIAMGLSHHHVPLLSGPWAELSCSLHVANALSWEETVGLMSGATAGRIDPPALSLLRLDEARLARCLETVGQEMREAQSFLEVS